MANEFKVKKGLIVHGSGSTVLDIQGSQGQLFSITDDLTGTLFAVSDISGIPILDVNSNGTSYFDGKLGIGTATPSQKLHVVGNQVRLDTAGGGYYIYNTSGTFRGAFHDNGTTTNIFGDGNGSTAAISIDSNNSTFSGKIKTTSTATGAIEIAGGTGVSTTGAFILRQNGNGAGNGMAITSGHATSHRIWKDASGNLNIGSSGNADAFKQDITGNVTIEGDLTLTQTSGNNIVFINSSGGGNPVIYMQDSTRKWGQFVSNGDLFFKDETSNIESLKLDGGNGNAIFGGDVTVAGTLTAQEFHTEFVSASIIYQSGSTKFGDTSDDVHNFTGSIKILGGDENQLYLNTNSTGQQTTIFYQVNGSFKYQQRVGTNWELYNYATSNWDFHIQGSTGRLGLGTTSPTTKLHLADTSDVYLTLESTSTGTPEEAAIKYSNYSTGANYWWQGLNQSAHWSLGYGTDFGGSTTKLFVNTSGNVGIGTTSPGAPLHVYASEATIKLQSSHGREASINQGGGNFHIHAAHGSGVAINYGNTSHPGLLKLYNNTTSKVQVNANGDSYFNGGGLGIGTTSPTFALHVNSSSTSNTSIGIGNTSSGVSRLYIDAGNGDFAGSDYMWLGQNNDLSGEIFMAQNAGSFHIKSQPSGTTQTNVTVTQAGNVGIGTTSPSQKLTVVGNTYVSSGLLLLDNNQDIRWGDAGERITGHNTNGLVFTTNNFETMRINSQGKVGIGTTDPESLLQVGGLDDGSNYDITLGWNAVDSEAVGTKRSAITFKTGQTSVNTEDIYKWDIAMLAAPATVTNEEFGSDLAFLRSTRGSTATDATTMILTRTGNVGIGTTSPSQTLEVHSTIKIGKTGVTGGRLISGDSMIFQIDSDASSGTSSYRFRANGTGDDGTELMRIQENGNVGIGTTSPSAGSKLEVIGKGDQLGSTGFYVNSSFKDDANVGVFICHDDTVNTTGAIAGINQLSFITYGSSWGERMKITGAGNVGIGTTVPQTKLAIGSAQGSGIDFLYDATNNYKNQIKNYWNSGTDTRMDFNIGRTSGVTPVTVMSVGYNGNVGIGTTSPTSKLHVLRSGGSTTANTSLAKFSDSHNTDNGLINKIVDSTITRTSWSNSDIISGYFESKFVSRIGGSNAYGVSALVSYDQNYSNAGSENFAGNLFGLHSKISVTQTAGNSFAQNAYGLYVEDLNIGTNAKLTNYYGIRIAGKTGSGTVTNQYALVTDNDAGNVGIGTPTPNHKLTVNGDIGLTDGKRIWFRGSSASSGTGAQSYVFSDGLNLKIKGDDNVQLLGDGGGVIAHFDYTGKVGIGTTSPAYTLHAVGGSYAGGKVTYSKSAGSLDTTGYAVAGITAAPNGNGASCGFTFTCFGHTGGYQKIVYSCYNGAGTWYASKVIEEGTNQLDVVASANGSTITFTFKSRSGTMYYTPRVTVEATGQNINSTYA